MVFVNKCLFSKIATTAKKELIQGIYGQKHVMKSAVKIKSVFSPENKVSIPISCFTRNKLGDIVLYRGLKNIDIADCEHMASSMAAHQGKSPQQLLEKYKSLGYNAIEDLANEYSGLTQGMDPILHTTTMKSMAKRFASNDGVLIEYHIPQKFLEQEGIAGHLGENEIDFFHSIPEKYVAKISKIKPKIQNENSSNTLKKLPSVINIKI